MTVAIKVPGSTASSSSKSRQPLYISQNTQSVAIAVNGGTPTVANLAAGSANCTPASGNARTCTVTISAPGGETDTFSETTYATTNGTGAVLSQNSTTAFIVAGKANTVTLTLDGVVASIVLALTNTSPPLGSPATIPLTVTLLDASGAAIIGSAPFVNGVTLTDSDSSGTTKLSQTTIASPAAASGLTVAYSGAALSPGATFGATATGVPSTSVTTTTLTPASAALVDYPTYAYDNARDGFNPYTGAITPASMSQLHLAWQAEGAGATTQPIIATNIAGQTLLIVASYFNAQAYNALTGKLVWQTTLPKQDVQSCGSAGISGTAYYDAALGAVFMVAGNGGGAPNHVVLYKLNVASGTIAGQVDVTPTLLPGEANDSHAGVSFANGRVYVGTGSDCEGSSASTYPSWRGRLVAVDPSSLTVLNTFFTTWGHGGNYGGGGVWAWGGVASDPNGNIYLAAGNGETYNSISSPQTISPPFVGTNDETIGYAEHLVKLSGDLTQVLDSDSPAFNYKIGCCDLDYTGVPVVYQPPMSTGCGMQSATQGKGGTLVINSIENLAEVQTFALSVPSASAFYMGNPAYSPDTGYLYAAITSSGNGSSMLPPGLAAIGGCGTSTSIVWHAQFGPDSTSFSGDNPRSAPTVTAGGVVLIGTPCGSTGGGTCTAGGTVNGGAIWAVDAKAGTVLGGKPAFVTADTIRVPPTVDGKWIWVYDNSGNLYGLTIDTSVAAVAAKAGHRLPPAFKVHG